jgi:hypothetical protein
MRLGWIQRKKVLRSIAGVSDEEMREATCEAHEVKRKRIRTVHMLPFEFIEIPLQSMRRKFGRTFCR